MKTVTGLCVRVPNLARDENGKTSSNAYSMFVEVVRENAARTNTGVRIDNSTMMILVACSGVRFVCDEVPEDTEKQATQKKKNRAPPPITAVDISFGPTMRTVLQRPCCWYCGHMLPLKEGRRCQGCELAIYCNNDHCAHNDWHGEHGMLCGHIEKSLKDIIALPKPDAIQKPEREQFMQALADSGMLDKITAAAAAAAATEEVSDVADSVDVKEGQVGQESVSDSPGSAETVTVEVDESGTGLDSCGDTDGQPENLLVSGDTV